MLQKAEFSSITYQSTEVKCVGPEMLNTSLSEAIMLCCPFLQGSKVQYAEMKWKIEIINWEEFTNLMRSANISKSLFHFEFSSCSALLPFIHSRGSSNAITLEPNDNIQATTCSDD